MRSNFRTLDQTWSEHQFLPSLYGPRTYLQAAIQPLSLDYVSSIQNSPEKSDASKTFRDEMSVS